jgi:CDP-glycerol glycerophosphotransferase
MAEDGAAILGVQKDLDDDERGRFNQQRLRRTVHAPARTEPLRDAVIYSSFRGRQYSDSPRAIHEELVRREAPFEHLWVVGDGQCEVPRTATVLRDGSREYHEALARARYVVYNDHFPEWYVRRPDQVCVQTWHGTPLKRLGFDASQKQRTIRRFERGWRAQVANWQYVVSPNRFSTPFLRQAYAIEGEMLETGYPRDDVLAGAGRDPATQGLRRRLGLPDGVRVVLYAPTYRDHVTDPQGRYRLDLRLDVERLREVLGPDTVLLMRKHHYVIDDIPVTDDGFVRDVSSFPDGTELMLAADVLITDYSSMMFDFANTGRPMLFFTYDLDAYRDEIRGFYFDFVATAPGPLLRTSDEVAEALRDLDAVKTEYAGRYAEFASTFCELDDGHASARVVDRVFSW